MSNIKSKVWNINQVKKDLIKAFNDNSETSLLKLLKDNSFLFYELFSRKYGIQPIFREVDFGGKFRCDYAWLNDNSDGPEWVLVELEKPRMKVFNQNNKPSSELNNAIEQVKTWDRYFIENPLEKNRIFGAVAKFRYILIAGDKASWESESAIKWRNHHNSLSNIEIRTSEIFNRSIQRIANEVTEFWSFEEHPKTLGFSSLANYWENYNYMDRMRQIF